MLNERLESAETDGLYHRVQIAYDLLSAGVYRSLGQSASINIAQMSLYSETQN